MTDLPAPVEELEIDLLLEALHRRYGYDFRGYVRGTLKRRILKVLEGEDVGTISRLQDRVLHDPASAQRLVEALTVNYTELFRDPEFFLRFRTELVGPFRDLPLVRIWHAGCSTGEEVFSMALLLHEEGLYDRCMLYATDISNRVLERARERVIPAETLERCERDYRAAGGRASLTEYFTVRYGRAILNKKFVKNMMFARHNLSTDESFNEFNIIVCRNVLIYFRPDLRTRAFSLFHASLARQGILVLGSRETLADSPHQADYESILPGLRVFRRAG